MNEDKNANKQDYLNPVLEQRHLILTNKEPEYDISEELLSRGWKYFVVHNRIYAYANLVLAENRRAAVATTRQDLQAPFSNQIYISEINFEEATFDDLQPIK